MATTPTNLPIPSEDPRDLKFNAGKFDEVMTSDSHYYTDRFGKQRWTIAGFQFTAQEAIRNYGYITMDSFEDGATLTIPNQVLRYEATGEYYRWDGALPKTVAAGSTPASTGGVGLGAWLSVGDASLRSQLANGNGSLIGVKGGGTLDQALTIKTPEQFNAVGDGIADDTDALQALFDYCAPFEWKGSISATRAAWGKVRAIASGFGKYRITRPLMINPFLTAMGNYRGAFFGLNGGFQIIADFDDKDGFALDTACYDTTGVRILGRKADRTDWDNSNYSGCPGWTLDGLIVSVASGRNLRGILNRAIGIQSSVINCGFSGANIGIQTSCTWGGCIQEGNIIARAIAVYNSNDTTDDYQNHIYLSVLGTKPSTSDFDYPVWPNADLQGKTACLFNEYSSVTHHNCVWEKSEVGAMVARSTGLDLDGIYAEAVTGTIVAGYTVDLRFKPRVLACPSASLFYIRGGDSNLLTIDLSTTNLYGIGSAFVKEVDPKVVIKGVLAQPDLPYYQGAIYDDVETNGMRNIYVSSGGSDSNSGFFQNHPLLTLQEAFDRCGSGSNRIVVFNTIGTKYTYTSGGTATTKIMNIDCVELVSGGANGVITVGANGEEVHSIPMGVRNIRIANLTINGNNTSAVMSGGYRPFIACNGSVNVNLEGVTHNNGVLMGTKFNRSGFVNLTAKGSTIGGVLCYRGGSSGFSWIDTGSPDTTATGTVGTGKKISSELYP